MAKQNTLITTQGETQIGTIMRRPDALSWFATFYSAGTYASNSLAWQWQHASDTATYFPLKDLGGNAVTSSSATSPDSFNSQFGTGKNNSDHIKLFVNVTGGSTTGLSLNTGFYDNQ